MKLVQALIQLSTVGHLPEDDYDGKIKKSFLVYLALFMSGGGLLWGTIALANGLAVQSLIPYGYTVITAFNLYYFYKTKNFNGVRFVQIFISLILPFLFQWSLGGFFASGVLMLWSLLALVASPSFHSTRSSVIWLIFYVVLTVISGVFEGFFYGFKPDILGDKSLLFVTLNVGVIGSIIFFLVVYFVQRSNNAQEHIKKVNADLNSQQGKMSGQKDRLQAAIEETNDIIVRALKTGNFDLRMNTEDKEGAWKELAQSINSLFDAIVKPLDVVQDISSDMAQGNLTNRFDDEAQGQVLLLKNSLNSSLDQFSDLLQQIRHRSDEITDSLELTQISCEEMSSGTMEINSAVNEISHGATDQLTKVDQASNLINTLANSAKDIDRQAQSISVKALAGVKKSDHAIENVNDLTEVVDRNLDLSNTLLENCRILEEESNAVAGFTKLITEIAAQTNLLSLNAGIQAADAGEHGKGFGVVAEEIRLLAERARGSVLEIENLISGMQGRVRDTQKTVVDMNGSIKKNMEFSQTIRKDFGELVQDMNEVVSESKTISEATGRQSLDLNEIVKLTENIVAIAEETAASSTEVADSTNGLAKGMEAYMHKNSDLLDIARDLHRKTTKFTLGNNSQVVEV